MAVTCGDSLTAAVTEHIQGRLGGDKGHFGLTALEHQPVQAFVGGLEMFGAPIFMTAVGHFHSAAVSADTGGEGDHGNLCHGDKETRPSQTRRGKEEFGGSEAVMVECGDEHTLVVPEDGELGTLCQNWGTVIVKTNWYRRVWGLGRFRGTNGGWRIPYHSSDDRR